MCKSCFPKGIDGFATWQDFEFFSQDLEAKRKVGLVSIEKLEPPSLKADLAAIDAYYQCSSCNERWALSSPDNAWRGYFLPVKQAEVYKQHLKSSDRTKSVAGLLLISIALLFLLWKVVV